MKSSRYFWGTFRSVASKDFVAFRAFTFGDTEYSPGDPFDKEAATRRQLETLFNAKKIKPVDLVTNNLSDRQEGTVERDEEEKATDVANSDKSASAVNSEDIQMQGGVKVVKGKAGYFHVEDEAGEKVGKATRDEAEAEEIKRAYERGEEIPD